ncbi:DUF6382 domain-containing protein [Paenibacillus arenilitoris]|uniref:FHA domain-containing protein n=1 Tax=Paenibacillus arenilitoris TaxID=2772299 RepID=A0A927H5P4_9BACL|nr:DUF6382 domain-containing protein [Paenibacillus arenilitoris]MBD2867769.1 FHA domain-containing protein [Paenibacillus arenilitoris]
MQSYRIDFAMNRGHEMTLDREHGIERSELDDIELRMLQSGRIPFLLPVDWHELNGEVTFRYALSGVKMLLHRLQQQPLSMEQYYELILGVTDALGECRHYMLRPEGCLLDEQFIFIGERLHDIRLAYVPMKEGGSPAAAGDLMSLVVRFTSYVERIDGEGLKRVLQSLNGKKWPLEQLRATLLDLINGARSQGVQASQVRTQPERPKPDAIGQSSARREASRAEMPRNEMRLSENRQQETLQAVMPQPAELQPAEPQPQRRIDEAHPWNRSGNHRKSEYEPLPYIDDEDEQSGSDAKKKWLYSAGAAVAIGCVWRFVYMASPARQSLLISAGLTLLLLALLLFVWRRGSLMPASSLDAEFETKPAGDESGPLIKLARWQAEQEDSDSAAPQTPQEEFAAARSNPYPDIPPLPAVPLAEPTALLRRETGQEHADGAVTWLCRSWEEQETRIELMEPCLKIGRSGDQLGYEDHANGISRMHLEIESADGAYYAKDLGSRNGSLLNGKTMVPYKAYRFEPGDVIHLADMKGPAYELRKG